MYFDALYGNITSLLARSVELFYKVYDYSYYTSLVVSLTLYILLSNHFMQLMMY
jgi:cytosine/uracil/thiamine/allantoin permease